MFSLLWRKAIKEFQSPLRVNKGSDIRKKMGNLEDIKAFLETEGSGLQLIHSIKGEHVLVQKTDGKSLKIKPETVEAVLNREDSEGNPFLQVNFLDGQKVLLTKHLIGFKPSRVYGLDDQRLPKVVTTPDLLSIIDVITDEDHLDTQEFDVLRKVYLSIVDGGEAVGFDLSKEREWLAQMTLFAANA